MKLLLLLIYSFQALAQTPVSYAERGHVYKFNGQSVRVLQRTTKLGDGSNSLTNFTVHAPGAPAKQSAYLEGNVYQNGIHAKYSKALSHAQLRDAVTILDAGYHSTRSGMGLPTLSLTIQVSQPAPDVVLQAQVQMTEFQKSAAESAQMWLNLNFAELQHQNAVVQEVQNGVDTYKMAADKSFVDAAATAFVYGSETNELSEKIEMLDLATQIKNNPPMVESLVYTEDKQQEILSSLSETAFTDPSRAGEMVADLASPINKSTTATIQQELEDRGVKNGVITGPVIGDHNIQFKDDSFGDQKLRIQNRLQALGRKYEDMMVGKGLTGVRAAQTWLQAAANAEAAGEYTLAETYMQKAWDVANTGPNDPEWQLQNYADALTAYNAGINASATSGMQFQSTDGEFLNVARPVDQFLETVATSPTASADQKAVANIGKEFLGHADSLLKAGDKPGSDAMLAASIAAVDVLTGFVPVVSTLKDSYEAISGKHWLTGEKLSNFERGLAVASVLTLGFGSAAIKGIKHVTPLLKNMKVADALIGDGTRIHKAYKTIGVKSAQTYAKIHVKVKGLNNFDDAERVILQTGLDVDQRLAHTGFKHNRHELLTSEVLNTKMMAKGKEPYVRSGTFARKIEALEHPSDLRRISTEDTTAGKWWVHKDVIDAVRAKSSSAEDFAYNLKQTLNLNYLPTTISSLKPSSTSYAMIVSELGAVPNFATFGKGQLQFEMINHVDPKNVERLESLTELFNKGGL